MTVRTILSTRENTNAVGYAAVYVGTSKKSKRVPTKKRITMIKREMDGILDDTQDYLLRHMIADDIGDEARNALFKAAMKFAYLQHDYDVLENTVTYYPTCRDLILNDEMIEEAEKFFYMQKDKFPPEYSRALICVVRDAENKQQLKDRKNQAHRYEENSESDDVVESIGSDEMMLARSMHVRIDSEMVDKLATSWRDLLVLNGDEDEDDDDDDDDDSSFAFQEDVDE